MVDTGFAVGSELILSKVHQQVSLAVWHDSLERERKVGLVVMERLDERLQSGRKWLGSERPHVQESLARIRFSKSSVQKPGLVRRTRHFNSLEIGWDLAANDRLVSEGYVI